MIAGSGPLFVNTGITVVYILGALLPWRIVCFVCASLPVSTILLSKWIPESPVWLKNNQRTEEAKEVRDCFLNQSINQQLANRTWNMFIRYIREHSS